MEFQDLNPTVKFIERLLRLLNTVFTNCTILISYLVIYFIILRTYRQLGMAVSEDKNMQRNLQSLLIMFASICLIYIIRIWRDVEILSRAEKRINFSYFVLSAKIILTTGICISLYKRLLVAVSIRQAQDN